MKTNLSKNLVAVAFSLAAFSTAGSTESRKTVTRAMPSAQGVSSATTTAAKDEPAKIAQLTATPGPDVSPVRWADIKDYPFEMRVSFLADLKRLEAKVDKQIEELNAKRAAMKSDTDTKAWDFAMKEMGDARSNLKSTAADLSKANAETWNQQKEKVGLAWMKTQDAYDKVKASTTN